VIFFAYIGFDAVSTAAQEARDPQRDMPVGILARSDLHRDLHRRLLRAHRHDEVHDAQRRRARAFALQRSALRCASLPGRDRAIAG